MVEVEILPSCKLVSNTGVHRASWATKEVAERTASQPSQPRAKNFAEKIRVEPLKGKNVRCN